MNTVYTAALPFVDGQVRYALLHIENFMSPEQLNVVDNHRNYTCDVVFKFKIASRAGCTALFTAWWNPNTDPRYDHRMIQCKGLVNDQSKDLTLSLSKPDEFTHRAGMPHGAVMFKTDGVVGEEKDPKIYMTVSVEVSVTNVVGRVQAPGNSRLPEASFAINFKPEAPSPPSSA